MRRHVVVIQRQRPRIYDAAFVTTLIVLWEPLIESVASDFRRCFHRSSRHSSAWDLVLDSLVRTKYWCKRFYSTQVASRRVAPRWLVGSCWTQRLIFVVSSSSRLAMKVPGRLASARCEIPRFRLSSRPARRRWSGYARSSRGRLSDKRLDRRLIKTGRTAGELAGLAINEACGDWAARKPRIVCLTTARRLAGDSRAHIQATVSACWPLAGRVVMQDTVFFSYGHHRRPKVLGLSATATVSMNVG